MFLRTYLVLFVYLQYTGTCVSMYLVRNNKYVCILKWLFVCVNLVHREMPPHNLPPYTIIGMAIFMSSWSHTAFTSQGKGQKKHHLPIKLRQLFLPIQLYWWLAGPRKATTVKASQEQQVKRNAVGGM